MLDRLADVRGEAQALLPVASSAAREEWRRLEPFFPSTVEIERGFVTLSRMELREMLSKVRRFRDILAANHTPSLET
jgi:hypothetical protein